MFWWNKQITELKANLAQEQERSSRLQQELLESQERVVIANRKVDELRQEIEQRDVQIAEFKKRETPIKDFALKMLEVFEKMDEAVDCLPDDLKPASKEESEGAN